MRGLGRGRGVEGTWPENQLQLLLALLGHRAKGADTAALANVVVWLWLWWGDQYVPLRQVRRALRTWAAANETAPWSRAEARARTNERLLRHPSARRQAKRTFREALATAAFSGYVDTEALQEASVPLFDPSGADAPRGPAGARVTADGFVRLIAARRSAVDRLSSFSDQDYAKARAVYIRSRHEYGRHANRFAADPEIGSLFGPSNLNEVVNHACLDLVSVLGLAAQPQVAQASGTYRQALLPDSLFVSIRR